MDTQIVEKSDVKQRS